MRGKMYYSELDMFQELIHTLNDIIANVKNFETCDIKMVNNNFKLQKMLKLPQKVYFS